MTNIRHKLLIKAAPEKVYDAITTQQGLAGWWTVDAVAKPETGSIARFPFGPDYFKEMSVDELTPHQRVKWTCLKAGPEWIGTTILFELQPHEKGTVLLFSHDGWKDYTPMFATCSYDWAMFLRSLKLLCETGKGTPFPEPM